MRIGRRPIVLPKAHFEVGFDVFNRRPVAEPASGYGLENRALFLGFRSWKEFGWRALNSL